MSPRTDNFTVKFCLQTRAFPMIADTITSVSGNIIALVMSSDNFSVWGQGSDSAPGMLPLSGRTRHNAWHS